MRRESDAEPAFRAAEWRWSIPEVCDDNWHTYSILFASVDQVYLIYISACFICFIFSISFSIRIVFIQSYFYNIISHLKRY